MKFKKLIISIFLVLVVFVLTGCMRGYEDLVVEESELGSWEGNYIYQGNKRSRTTGDDSETLVKEIFYDGIYFSVFSVDYYKYIDNNIYMIANTKNKANQTQSDYDSTILLKYNILEKSTEVLYVSASGNDLNGFFYVCDDFMILSKNTSSGKSLVKVDINTKEVEEIRNYKNYWLVEDYLIVDDFDYVLYTKLDEIEFLPLSPVTNNHNKSFKMVNINGRKMIRIFTTFHKSDSNFIGDLKYYDLDSKHLFTAWKSEDDRNLSLVGDEYFIIGEAKSYSYVSSLQDYETKNHITLDEILSVNNILYKVSFDNGVFEAKKSYSFEADIDFTTALILPDNNILINGKWVKKGTQLSPGGVKSKDYLYDVANNKLISNYKYEEPEYIYDPLDHGLEFNDYIYYFESIKYGPMMLRYDAYYLYRYNKKTKEREIIQFFAIEDEEVRGTRFSEDFWKKRFLFNKEMFLILDY